MGELIERDGRFFRWSGSRLVEVVPGTIHLQGIGRVPAKPARELRVGDRIVWNHGAAYRVEAVRPHPSGRTLEIDERSEETGVLYPGRRLGAGRLVGIA